MTRPQHIPALDGFRGCAVLWVFLYHYGGGTTSPHLALRAFGQFCRAGWAGVTLFFVLSGFLITRNLRAAQGTPGFLRAFYTKRARRILPLYYGVLLLCFASAFLVPGSAGAALRFYAAPVFFLLDFGPHSNAWIAHLPAKFSMYHLWSLSVEEQFYLLWPLLFVWVRSRRGLMIACAGIFASSCLFRETISAGAYALLLQTLPVRAGELALGALLGLVGGPVVVGSYKKLATLFLATAIAAILCVRVVNGAALSAASLAAGALLLFAISGGFVAKALENAWLRRLGRISYGVYVFHVLFVSQFFALAVWITGQTAGTKFLAVRFVVAAAGTLLAATLSWQLYEKRWLRSRAVATVDSVARGARY